jgi:aryl-phospho-beta-D-glucosidase BglC (GH1 family)
MDLRNEIRKANGRTPTWGDENALTDWHRAAQKIGNDLQDIAPEWLIIVGGLFYQMDLTGVYEHPILLKIPNKLVYSGHIYGFSWPAWVAFGWQINSYGSFWEKVFNEQTYVRNLNVPFIFG